MQSFIEIYGKFLLFGSITICICTYILFISLVTKKRETIMEPDYIINNKIKKIYNIDQNNSNTFTCNLPGIFEIHITVDPRNNYVKLVSFIEQNEKIIKLKVIHAITSIGNNQYMISHFTQKDNINDVIDKATYLANKMEEFGLIIKRVKVESHSMVNAPQNNSEYLILEKYLKDTFNTSKPYFEFHAKVNNKTDGFTIEKLEQDVAHFGNISVSYNLCSAHMKPLLTIRLFDCGFIEAENYKNYVLNNFKQIGYGFEALQQEFSIYDTNQKLDDGWIKYVNL
jgi:hypothetical protein